METREWDEVDTIYIMVKRCSVGKWELVGNWAPQSLWRAWSFSHRAQLGIYL